MASTPFPTPEALEILKRIKRRRDAARARPGAENPEYFGAEFEHDVQNLLNRLFPFSVLSGLRLFSPERRLQSELGIEIDNLMHFRLEGTDYVIVVEAKNQELRINGKEWLASYDGVEKCAREQVDKHIETLREYLAPISRDIDLKFVAIVCSAGQTTMKQEAGYLNSELHLTSIDGLIGLLDGRFLLKQSNNGSRAEVLRVTQSGFLDLLRLSLPVPELGHPEFSSALRYVERCRRTLDESLFQDFTPTSERWVINGSAGMGKSVLLAYTAAVLCSGYMLDSFQGETYVRKADDVFSKIGFKADHNLGSIGILTMSAKQLESVRRWFDQFVAQFQKADQTGDVRFRQAEFIHCRDAEQVAALARRCRALLVDEAHDLPAYAAREIAKLHGERAFYLAVACDRHQKLRLTGSDAKIIEGLDFTNKSIRLKQIYRNPVPIYIASLALMFRWFAETGPKVVPSPTDLQKQFGFDVTSIGKGHSLTIKSDAHPANSWSHTVATFPNANAAYNALTRERVGQQELLWIRFSEEDPSFDYEYLLRNFTYHNCRSRDAYKISDKYVKGQEYPIVVIEGFPSFMDRFFAEDKSKEHEDKMWAFRRELYLCASRATCFLYFICNVPETEEILRIKGELGRLVDSAGLPRNPSTGGARSWTLFLSETDPKDRRSLDVFADATPSIVEEDEPESISVPISRPARAERPFTPSAPPPPTPEPPTSPFDVLSKLSEAPPPKAEPELVQVAEKAEIPFPLSAPVILSPVASTSPAPAFVEDAFKSKLTVAGPLSVMQLARELGVQHRDVMLHATRMKIYTTGGTLLSIQTMRAIAAKYGFGLIIAGQDPNS